ncbi:hypothetical protein JCM10450v2_003538 [Rhodotorula kratochvilovae]
MDLFLKPLAATDAECAVCRAPTKNKCSSCLRAKTDLYFCSPEHQKLAWPAHKLVCGKPGFSPPSLSDDEHHQLNELVDARIWLQLVLGLSLDLMEIPWARSLWLTSIRFTLYAALNTRGPRSLPYKAHSALTHAAVLSSKVRHFAHELDVKLLAPFEHQLLVFCHLVQLKSQGQTPPGWSDELIFRALERTLAVLAPLVEVDSQARAWNLARIFSTHVHPVIRIISSCIEMDRRLVVLQCRWNPERCSCCAEGCDSHA